MNERSRKVFEQSLLIKLICFGLYNVKLIVGSIEHNIYWWYLRISTICLYVFIDIIKNTTQQWFIRCGSSW